MPNDTKAHLIKQIEAILSKDPRFKDARIDITLKKKPKGVCPNLDRPNN